jgi:hypothetical protein
MPALAWFAPAQLLVRAQGAGFQAADLGAEPHDGKTSEHLRFWRVGAGTPAPLAETMADVYLDAATGLPAALDFRVRPYLPPGTKPAPHVRAHLGLEEIRFSGYQSIAGRLVPMHIQAFMGTRPIFDITLTSAAFDRGVTLAALQ